MQTNRVEYPINSGYIQIVAEGNMLRATFPAGVLFRHESAQPQFATVG